MINEQEEKKEEKTVDYKAIKEDPYLTDEGKAQILMEISYPSFEDFINKTRRGLIEKEINGE